MAKFSQQIVGARNPQLQTFDVTNLRRTQRQLYKIALKKAQEQREITIKKRKEEFEKTKKKVAEMSLPEYKVFYQNIKEDWLKRMFSSPKEIEAQRQAEI